MAPERDEVLQAGHGDIPLSLQRLGRWFARGLRQEKCQDLNHGLELSLDVQMERIRNADQQRPSNPEDLLMRRAASAIRWACPLFSRWSARQTADAPTHAG